MGTRDNKVFLPLAGKPVLAYSLRAFGIVDQVWEIIIVTRSGEEERAREIAAPLVGAVKIVPGGERRQDSALAGVRAATGEIVLLHDAARPFPSPGLIVRVIAETERYGACVPVVPVVDTLRYADQDGFLRPHTVMRTGLFRMQTPQGFLRAPLRAALSTAEEEITDDASAVLAVGGAVHTTSGEETNIKLTRKADLSLASALIAAKIVVRSDHSG